MSILTRCTECAHLRTQLRVANAAIEEREAEAEAMTILRDEAREANAGLQTTTDELKAEVDRLMAALDARTSELDDATYAFEDRVEEARASALEVANARLTRIIAARLMRILTETP